jgi:hypothetical protein
VICLIFLVSLYCCLFSDIFLATAVLCHNILVYFKFIIPNKMYFSSRLVYIWSLRSNSSSFQYYFIAVGSVLRVRCCMTKDATNGHDTPQCHQGTHTPFHSNNYIPIQREKTRNNATALHAVTPNQHAHMWINTPCLTHFSPQHVRTALNKSI